MATVQDWVDSIRMDVSEPLDTMVARQVRYAIQEFFRLSEAWVHSERVELTGDTAELSSLPINTYVASTKYAYFEPAGRDGRYKLVSELAHRVGKAGRVGTFAHRDNTILLDAFEKGTLEVAVVVQPNRSIESVPDSLCDKWFDVIRRGALARLLSMPEKLWSDARAAAAYEMHFREGITMAKREVRDDRSRPKRSIKFNQGYAW